MGIAQATQMNVDLAAIKLWPALEPFQPEDHV